MPLTNSYNALALNNQQPEYQVLWEPIAINPLSAYTNIPPYVSGSVLASGVGWVPGALLCYSTTQTLATGSQLGVGSYPAGIQSGGDTYNSGNPNFPGNWTVQQCDIAPVSTTTQAAGILLGVGGLGLPSPVVPNTIAGSSSTSSNPSQVAMVGKRGICQVWVSSATTIGDTLQCATTAGYVGTLKDSSGTTATYGTTYGIALQTLTLGTAPKLCWAYINMP